MTDAKRRRVEEANAVILAVSRHGRRFFDYPARDGVSRFELSEKGETCFHDGWSRETFRLADHDGWRHFTNGGTLRSLVEALACYVEDGLPIDPAWFGPWPHSLNGGDLWGYGREAMDALRGELDALPAVAPRTNSSEARP